MHYYKKDPQMQWPVCDELIPLSYRSPENIIPELWQATMYFSIPEVLDYKIKKPSLTIHVPSRQMSVKRNLELYL